jgi:hypothetical protein
MRTLKTVRAFCVKSIVVFRALSLDVVSGAIACGWMAQIHTESSLPLAWLVILGFSVWAVYTADHLLDAMKLGINAAMYRHRFHAIHIVPLGVACFISASIALSLALIVMDFKVVLMGFLTGGVAMLHFGAIWWAAKRNILWPFKELGVASIYTIGVWGPPILMCTKAIPWLLIIGFGGIGLTNLIAFSYHENEADTSGGQPSLSRFLGERRACWVGLACCLFSLVLVSLSFKANQMDVLLITIVISMGSCQAVLFFLPRKWTQSEAYRIWGDAAFSLPWIYVCASILS